MVNGETVHQAGAPVLFTSTSFLPLPVNQPSQSHFLRQQILHFQIKTLHSLQQRKSAVCSCRCKYQRIGNKITLALGTIPSTESSQSWTGQQGLWKVLGGLFKGHSSKRKFVFPLIIPDARPVNQQPLVKGNFQCSPFWKLTQSKSEGASLKVSSLRR